MMYVTEPERCKPMVLGLDVGVTGGDMGGPIEAVAPAVHFANTMNVEHFGSVGGNMSRTGVNRAGGHGPWGRQE
jgi:hypothetical protein